MPTKAAVCLSPKYAQLCAATVKMRGMRFTCNLIPRSQARLSQAEVVPRLVQRSAASQHVAWRAPTELCATLVLFHARLSPELGVACSSEVEPLAIVSPGGRPQEPCSNCLSLRRGRRGGSGGRQRRRGLEGKAEGDPRRRGWRAVPACPVRSLPPRLRGDDSKGPDGSRVDGGVGRDMKGWKRLLPDDLAESSAGLPGAVSAAAARGGVSKGLGCPRAHPRLW